MEAKILGLVVTESKKGNKGTILSLEIPYDDYRKHSAEFCTGNDCVHEYIHGDLSSQIRVGETVTLVYGRGFEGKAVLREVLPVNEK